MNDIMKKKSDILKGFFGLERETLRVDGNGRLARSLHPFRSKRLSRDFCENQLEIITPVCDSVKDALKALGKLDAYARKRLAKTGESLWLYSNPPFFESEDEIPIAQYKGKFSFEYEYRAFLEKRYGKRLMLYSGIHFNFSFKKEFLKRQKESSDEIYLRLFRQLSKNSWLLVLLTAASPVYDRSFDKSGKQGLALNAYASPRSGSKGYWNTFVPVLDYSSVKNYVKSAQAYVRSGALYSAHELYLPVRIKPRGENSPENLEKTGIDHIELRMFDLDPLEKLGIAEKDLDFAHLLAIYLLSEKDFRFTKALQAEAIKNHQNAALYDLKNVWIGKKPIIEAALDILAKMERYYSAFPEKEEIKKVIAYEKEKLAGKRLCEKVREAVGSSLDNIRKLGGK